MPKSERLNVVVAEKICLSAFRSGVRCVTSRLMGLETPCNDNIPVNFPDLPEFVVRTVLSKTTIGKRATSKKSAVRKCSSRAALSVKMEPGDTWMITVPCSGAAGSNFNVPSKDVNFPSVEDTKRWPIVNRILLRSWFKEYAPLDAC